MLTKASGFLRSQLPFLPGMYIDIYTHTYAICCTESLRLTGLEARHCQFGRQIDKCTNWLNRIITIYIAAKT